MIFALLFTGCAEKEEDAPELLEPVAANAAYRPVEKGDIGTIKIMTGTVVPTDYCHFFHTSASISRIVVDIGDYVEEGTVLAYADVDSAGEQAESIQADIDYNNAQYEQQCQISDDRIKELTYKKQACSEAGDSTAAAEVQKEIDTEKENRRYDDLLHDYQIGKLQAQLEKQQEIISDGTLKARHAGYVTYVMDISQSREASASENVVVVSDETDLYIELTGISLKEYAFSDYPVKYIMQNHQQLSLCSAENQ
jgi:multidrug efflux pump subunit AcrA (membrane-fusion protein)